MNIHVRRALEGNAPGSFLSLAGGKRVDGLRGGRRYECDVSSCRQYLRDRFRAAIPADYFVPATDCRNARLIAAAKLNAKPRAMPDYSFEGMGYDAA